LVVTPDETVPSATVTSHELITRVFRICNTGNVSDAYQIVRAEAGTPANLVNLYFDNDNSGTVTAADSVAQINGSISATISPGATQAVASADSPFTYAISFRNSGDTPALGVVVIDDLATSLAYVPGSLSLDNKALTDADDADEGNVQGHRLVVHLAEVLLDR